MRCFVLATAAVGLAVFALPASAAHSDWRLSQTTSDQAVPAAPSPDATNSTLKADGTPATVIDDRNAEGILGKSVYSASGEDMGQIVDVIVKRDGQVRAAVIDFGGFLGVGNRKIAVDWSALHFPASGPMDHIILELNRDQVRLAPEYKPGEPLVVLGSEGETQPNPETPTAGP
jgi:PRC-barrel domain